MGFMYNPSKTIKHYLQVGIKPTLSSTSYDENKATISFATPYGPRVTITNLDNAVEYIKIAFVITRVASTAATGKVLPSGSGLLYSSSQIYTPVTTFNTPVALKQGTTALTDPNLYYYHLPDARYAIYGIHSFDLPKGSNISCSTILVNATLNNIDSYTVTTPNTSPSDFMFAADIFTVNIDKLCNPDSTNPTSSVFTTVGAKNFFTVPTMSLQQFILEQAVPTTTVSSGDTFNYAGYFRFNNYATPANNNTDRILFQTSIPFIGLTAGAPLKFEFAFHDDPVLAGTPNTGSPTDYVRMIQGQTYFIQLAVNGFILYQTNYVASFDWTASGGQLADSIGKNGKRLSGFIPIVKGINSNGTTANVVITVAYNRSLTLSQNVWT